MSPHGSIRFLIRREASDVIAGLVYQVEGVPRSGQSRASFSSLLSPA